MRDDSSGARSKYERPRAGRLPRRAEPGRDKNTTTTGRSLDRARRYREGYSTERRRGDITYFQAIFIGILQGITELFPVSSLGHSVILPALFGWDQVVTQQSSSESSFLVFLVGVHVATAIRGQALAGSVAAGISPYFSVRFLMRWFETRTLKPFAIYWVSTGALATLYFGVIR